VHIPLAGCCIEKGGPGLAFWLCGDALCSVGVLGVFAERLGRGEVAVALNRKTQAAADCFDL